MTDTQLQVGAHDSIEKKSLHNSEFTKGSNNRNVTLIYGVNAGHSGNIFFSVSCLASIYTQMKLLFVTLNIVYAS